MAQTLACYPLQMNLLDRAVKLAAEQDEPDEVNFVRKHAKEQVRSEGFSRSYGCLMCCCHGVCEALHRNQY